MTKQLYPAATNDPPANLPDLALIDRYDVPGPRYTSYPTAPHFAPLDHEAWLDLLRENQASSMAALSLYVHLPFCPSLCLYCGCNVEITRRRDRVEEYLRYLRREIDTFWRLVGTERYLEQMHWGGGTPSYLMPDEIRALGEKLMSDFSASGDAEISVEIDPRLLTREHVKAFRETGFNRASLGVQDFDERVQLAIGRIQTYEKTRQSIEWLREFGFQSVNLDLIYGLPNQNAAGFARTLGKVVSLNPDRLAVFNFAFVPQVKRHQRGIDPGLLPSRAEKIEILGTAISMLADAGYVMIGMDHFSRPEDELAAAQRKGRLHRNFQGYTTHEDCDVIAFGSTGISTLERAYAQNMKTLAGYYRSVGRGELPVERGIVLSDDDVIRRYAINELMCNLRLSISELEEKFGIVFADYFSDIRERLSSLVEDRLVEVSGEAITILPSGRFFLRNAAMAFDARYGAASAAYSRTV